MKKDVQIVVKKFFDDPEFIDSIQDTKLRSKLQQLKEAPSSRGRDFLIAHYLGFTLSRSEAVIANCCNCCGYYTDKRCDCEVYDCVLYQWMPYGKLKTRYVRPEKRIR